jgi:hypothetical protein
MAGFSLADSPPPWSWDQFRHLRMTRIPKRTDRTPSTRCPSGNLWLLEQFERRQSEFHRGRTRSGSRRTAPVPDVWRNRAGLPLIVTLFAPTGVGSCRVQRIALTVSANPRNVGHALFITVKAAVRAATAGVVGAPRSIGSRIHARQGNRDQRCDDENNCSHESLLGR